MAVEGNGSNEEYYPDDCDSISDEHDLEVMLGFLNLNNALHKCCALTNS